MKNSSEVFFPNLEAEIVRNHIPKKELEKILDVSHSTLTAKLNGKQQFTLNQIMILCNLFPNVPFMELFKVSESRKESQS